MITGRENKSLFPFTSEPTFSPMLAHQISRSDTIGGAWLMPCNFSFNRNQMANRFIRSKYTLCAKSDNADATPTQRRPQSVLWSALRLVLTILKFFLDSNVLAVSDAAT